jgi:DNA-binding MarR family transcriptional regulator
MAMASEKTQDGTLDGTLDGTVDGDTEITLGLLNAVQESSAVTQRSMANDLGIALGLANAYLKRCVRKGYIKVSQIPPNRYAYYLTPHGFSEKSRLTAEYLSSSFTFFRRARSQCEADLDRCAALGWTRVALAGASELAEIATLCAVERPVSLVGLIDPDRDPDPTSDRYAGLRVAKTPTELEPLDAILITDLRDPQGAYERLSGLMANDRLMTPPLLRVLREAPKP